MARRSQSHEPESLRVELVELLTNFKLQLERSDLRPKVRALIPAHHLLRDLGCSLVPKEEASSARDRVLLYLKKYPQRVIAGDELMVVSGIGEWARRVRELRVEFGWNIVTGVTQNEMSAVEACADLLGKDEISQDAKMGPDDYMLLSLEEDRDAAHRWNIANEIRKRKGLPVKERILAFMLKNVGKPVTGEELRYVSGGKSEWARRVRELRTEEGWALTSKNSGRPDLGVGVYVLEDEDQAPPHDRKIPDGVRRSVLVRDKYMCQQCNWSHDLWNKADPRHLELHHLEHHASGGENSEGNLLTVCTVCHKKIHKEERHTVSGRLKKINVEGIKR